MRTAFTSMIFRLVPSLVALTLSLPFAHAAQSAPAQTRVDLSATMDELQRIAAATDNDIANVRIDKWGSGWKVWRGGKGQQKEEMEHVAASLQKNLSNALPGMIKDVQASRGSLSTTFKLYHDVSVVHEYLNTLAEAAQANGKKEEYGPLNADLNALEGIREKLTSYIETAAASMESSGKMPAAAFNSPPSTPGQLPKKIIVDDPAAKKPTKKKSTPPSQ